MFDQKATLIVECVALERGEYHRAHGNQNESKEEKGISKRFLHRFADLLSLFIGAKTTYTPDYAKSL